MANTRLRALRVFLLAFSLLAAAGGLVLIGKAETMDSGCRTVRDMDSTEIPVYGEQEQRGYNGYFESTCFHPLLLFNREGDCLAAKLQVDGREGHIVPRRTLHYIPNDF